MPQRSAQSKGHARFATGYAGPCTAPISAAATSGWARWQEMPLAFLVEPNARPEKQHPLRPEAMTTTAVSPLPPIPPLPPILETGTLRTTPRAFQYEMHFRGILLRHQRGYWGDASNEDLRAANDAALRSGGRILGAYKMPDGHQLWVETAEDRSYTIFVLPDEYFPY